MPETPADLFSHAGHGAIEAAYIRGWNDRCDEAVPWRTVNADGIAFDVQVEVDHNGIVRPLSVSRVPDV